MIVNFKAFDPYEGADKRVSRQGPTSGQPQAFYLLQEGQRESENCECADCVCVCGDSIFMVILTSLKSLFSAPVQAEGLWLICL